MGNFLSKCKKSKMVKTEKIITPITWENPIHVPSQILTEENMEKHNKNSPLNKTSSEEKLSQASTVRRVFSFGNHVKSRH